MNPQSIIINLPPGALPGATAGNRPDWVRIPAPGENCPHTGLSRAGYYRLIKEGLLETRKMGKGRGGVCLVRYASLLAVIEGAPVSAAPEQLPAA